MSWLDKLLPKPEPVSWWAVLRNAVTHEVIVVYDEPFEDRVKAWEMAESFRPLARRRETPAVLEGTRREAESWLK